MAHGTGHERRDAPRVIVALDLRLERKVGRAVVARTRDLGCGGARVTSNRPLRVDEELSFDLALPRSGRHVTGTARVLRQHLHDVYALRFEQVAPGLRDELEAYVAAAFVA